MFDHLDERRNAKQLHVLSFVVSGGNVLTRYLFTTLENQVTCHQLCRRGLLDDPLAFRYKGYGDSMTHPFLKLVRPVNLLSFGPETQPIELRALNIKDSVPVRRRHVFPTGPSVGLCF
jgi:hypothetical protein